MVRDGWATTSHSGSGGFSREKRGLVLTSSADLPSGAPARRRNAPGGSVTRMAFDILRGH